MKTERDHEIQVMPLFGAGSIYYKKALTTIKMKLQLILPKLHQNRRVNSIQQLHFSMLRIKVTFIKKRFNHAGRIIFRITQKFYPVETKSPPAAIQALK
jgi:hypothetical protein